MSMVMFTEQNKTFVYLVAAAIIHENRVLLHRAVTDSFWALPGGRCEIVEPSILYILFPGRLSVLNPCPGQETLMEGCICRN